MRTIVIDPVTRIEGHLKIEAVTDNGVVKEARCSGLLFRGFENILRGRDPRDAQRITQRICGVCPTAHATASTLALLGSPVNTETSPKTSPFSITRCSTLLPLTTVKARQRPFVMT